MNGTVYLMDSQILRRRLFSICSHFFGANSLAKHVSEKQHVHVFCLQTRIQSERTSEHAARGGLILNGFSLGDATRESDKDDNYGRGGRRQQSADGSKQNWRAEMRRRQTGEQVMNRH